MAERDLAELEALLTRDLQGSPSPSIAADGGNGEQPLYDSGPDDSGPAPQPAPLAWTQATARQFEAQQPAPQVPNELKQHSSTEFRRGPAPELRRAPTLNGLDDRALFAAMLRADRRSPVAGAMRVAATIFSLVALVGVSALLVLLVAGGERTTRVAGDPARAGDSAVAAESASDALVSAERVGAPIVTGSTETKQDVSRVPSQGYSARAGGTVRAVDPAEASAQTQPPAEPSPAQNVPAASAAIADSPSADGAAPRSVFSPPAADQASAASQGFEPMNSGAAPAAEEPAAPAQAAATETGDGSAGAAQPQPGEPAPATRSAAVTTHVNMRASPDNDAAVVRVVPAKQNVEVVACTRWCEVVYDGQQGFIYRRFVSGAEE